MNIEVYFFFFNLKNSKFGSYDLPTFTLYGSFAIFNPAFCSKICRFSAIKAMIKTSVITIWKRDHYFSRFLSHLKKNNLKLNNTNNKYKNKNSFCF